MNASRCVTRSTPDVARTLARHDAHLARLHRLIYLLATATGIDLEHVELLAGVERRGPVRWEEFEALGLDPTGEVDR